MARIPIRRSNSDEEALERLAAPLRDAYVRQPEPEAERRHVAAMAAAARQAPAAAPATGTLARLRSRLTPAGRPGGRRLVPVAASTLAACFAFSTVSAGLAVAGVSLPDPVRAPFNAVGVTLPNQADDVAREALEMSKPRSSESERNGGDASRDARETQRRSVDPPGSRETGRERSQPGRDIARERSQQERGQAPSSAPQGAPRGAPEGTPRGAPEGTPRGAPQGAPRGGPQGPPGGATPQDGERPDPPRRPVTPPEPPATPPQGPRENGSPPGLGSPRIAPPIPDLGSG